MQRSVKDVLAGILFIAFGLAFAVGATTYEVGSPLEMGPGFFPLAVGGLLAFLGVLIIIKPDLEGEASPLTAPPWRALALVLGAIVAFGLTVRGLGLAPSTFVAALLASLSSRQTSVPVAGLLAVALTGVSILIFVFGLQLNVPLLGPWIPRP